MTDGSIKVYWQCPRCRHRVGEGDTFCLKCGRHGDGREEAFVIEGEKKSLLELEKEIRAAHAEVVFGTRHEDEGPGQEALVFHVPQNWKGPIIAAFIIGLVVGLVVIAQILMEGSI